MTRNAERLDQTIRMVDKNQTRSLFEFQETTERHLAMTDAALETAVNETKMSLEMLNNRLGLMAEDAVIRSWVTEKI
jgi:hypothetical protein